MAPLGSKDARGKQKLGPRVADGFDDGEALLPVSDSSRAYPALQLADFSPAVIARSLERSGPEIQPLSARSTSPRASTPVHGAHGLHGGDKCGVGKTLGNIFISFIGAGVLGLPYAFMRSGLLLATSVMLVVSILAYICILLLVDCKTTLESRGAVTYSDVAEMALGPTGKVFVEAMLVLSQTGFCVAYLLFIAENMAQLTPISRFGIVAIIVPFQIALAMLRNLSALAPFSLVADAANLVGMLVVLRDDVIQFSAHESIVFGGKGLSTVPFLFGVVIYCYEGVGMILPIQDSMANKAKFKATLTLGFGIITAVFIGFGAVGYLAFGDHTEDIITNNLADDWTTKAVKLSLSLGLCLTFPVMMVPVYEISERAMESAEWFKRGISPPRRLLVQRVGRFAVVLTVGFIATSVPGFGTFISLVGSLCCASLAFIVPALCHLLLHQDSLSRPRIALDVFLFCFGLVGMLVGVTDSLRVLLASQGVE